MNEPTRMLLLALFLLSIGSGLACAAVPVECMFLAAMPLLEASMTQFSVGLDSGDLHLSGSRAISSYLTIRAEARTSGPFDLAARFLAPLHIAPAFLAVEVASSRVTGLMTLFFGSVSIDLGRTWFEPSRWAFAQLIVHPRLTMAFGGIQTSEAIVPFVGWRLFPTASAQWEIDMLFSGREVRISVGGVL